MVVDILESSDDTSISVDFFASRALHTGVIPAKAESRIIKRLLDSGSALRAVRNDTGRIVRRLFAPACPDSFRCYEKWR